MASGNYPRLSPEKRTDFKDIDGKPVVLAKRQGRPPNNGRAGMKPGFVNDKTKIEAVTVYAVTGNKSEVQRLTGIHPQTFTKWQKEEWFHSLMDELRSENDAEFDAAATKILEKLVVNIKDRVENGDHVVLKDGSLIRKPVSLRDLIGAMMITIDKRQLLRGKPTSRSESVSADTRLEKLVNQFTELAKKTGLNRTQIGQVIDVEYTTEEPIKENEHADEQTAEGQTPLREEGSEQKEEVSS